MIYAFIMVYNIVFTAPCNISHNTHERRKGLLCLLPLSTMVVLILKYKISVVKGFVEG